MSSAHQKHLLTTTKHAWFIWLLSAGFLFYKYLVEVSPSVMANELMNEFSIHGAQLGNLAAFYFYAYLLMQMPVGVLIDRYGPRRLTTGAIFVCALGSLTLSHSSDFYIACLGRFLTGTGAAFAVVSCFKLISIWFPPKRFAFMSGLMMTAGMLGAVGGQAPLAELINAIGWRDALDSIAMVGIVYCIVFFAVVRDNNPNQATSLRTPKQAPLLQGIQSILKRRQNWLLSLFSGISFAPVVVVGGLWGVPFLDQAYGLSKAVAATDVSMVFIGFAIGAPLFGLWSDYIGKRKPLVYVGLSIAAILISITVYCPNLPVFFIAILLFGFGFFISAFLISFSMIRESNSILLAATSVAVMNAFNAALCAISDPLIGKFLDMTWDGTTKNGAPVFSVTTYQLAFSALPIYLISALVIFYFINETYLESPAVQQHDPNT